MTRRLNSVGAALFGTALLVAASGMVASAHAVTPNAKSSGKKIVLGLSNSYIGNVWRSEMVNDFKKEATLLQKQGRISRWEEENSGNNVPVQIQQIHDMVASGVNVLIIDASSYTGLNAAIDQAVAQGVTVVTFDNTAQTPKSTNILLDENIYAGKTAQGLANLIHGRGNVVLVNGVPGTPVNNLRQQIAEQVFKKYPHIKIVAQVYGQWSSPVAQQQMANVLAENKTVNAVWSSGVQAGGILRAFLAAKRPVPPIMEDGTSGFLNWWHAHLKDGYKTVGSLIPPGEVVDAIWIGLAEFNGWKAAHNPLILPAPYITNANISKFWHPNTPGGRVVDAILVPEQQLYSRHYLVK